MTAATAAVLAATVSALFVLLRLPGLGLGASSLPTAGPGHRRSGRNRQEETDPVPDDVAAEALSQAVALLQAGVGRTVLFRTWARTRDRTEPETETRQGRQRRLGRKQERSRRAWDRALVAADLQQVSGGDLDLVDGPGRAWRETVWAVGLSTDTGAPLAELLDRVRDECTARSDAARARTAGLAAARTTRRILMCLPAAGLLLAQALGARPLQILLTHPWGRAAAVLGLIFWAVAALWARLILRGKRTAA